MLNLHDISNITSQIVNSIIRKIERWFMEVNPLWVAKDNLLRVFMMLLAALHDALLKIKQSSAKTRLEILNSKGEERMSTFFLGLLANILSCLINSSTHKTKM